jgi:hypothetical protein
MGEAEASGAPSGEGLGTTGFGKLGGADFKRDFKGTEIMNAAGYYK